MATAGSDPRSEQLEGNGVRSAMSSRTPLPVYIVFEGPDGCGKTTQSFRLSGLLRSEGYDVLRVDEPYEKNPFGQLLRRLLKTGEHPESHAALFLANRIALQRQVILPALEAGRPVISCRSFISTLVYQQEQWPLDWLYALHEQLPVQPTHLIMLDVDPKTSLDRIRRRTETEIYEKPDVLERVRQRYADLMGDSRLRSFLHPECEPAVLDGRLEIDRVTEMARRVLDAALPSSKTTLPTTRR